MNVKQGGFINYHAASVSLLTEKIIYETLKLKNHGRQPQSLFRRGFDHLRRLIVNFYRFDVTEWLNIIKLLSCT